DVGVAERERAALRAVVVRSWPERGRVGVRQLGRLLQILLLVPHDWRGGAGEHVFAEGLPVCVDRRAVRGVAGVVPDARGAGPSGHRVVVVTEELGGEAVGAGTASVADGAT